MKKVLMITTGGTIASMQEVNGLTPLLTAKELLSIIKLEIKDLCEVVPYDLMSIDSTNMCPKYWVEIFETIYKNYNDYDSFVICHGTDTMSYTASILSYMVQNSPKPIILTGSQRPLINENTDAKINLIDSIRYACYDKACDVNVVFGGSVIAGTRAKKMRTKAYNAFSSINFPVIAEIFENKIVQYIDRPKNKKVKFYPIINSNVGLIYLTPGINSELLDGYLACNDAVVVSSYGSGGLPQGEYYNFDKVLEKYADKNKILVMTTQVTREGTDMTIYKVGSDLKSKYGFLDAYDMTPESILAKLMWILGQTKDKDEVVKMFYETVNFDILYKGVYSE